MDAILGVMETLRTRSDDAGADTGGARNAVGGAGGDWGRAALLRFRSLMDTSLLPRVRFRFRFHFFFLLPGRRGTMMYGTLTIDDGRYFLSHSVYTSQVRVRHHPTMSESLSCLRVRVFFLCWSFCF